MDASRREIKRSPEPVDERGDLKEDPEFPPRDHPPPIRLDSLTFPTNRLPKLEVEIVTRLPDVGKSAEPRSPESTRNLNVDPSLPSAIEPEKTLFNLWEKTQTQIEVRWSKPENSSQFNSILYEIQIKDEEGVWQDLADCRHTTYRVYFIEGKAIFGRTKICQKETTLVVHIRIRPVGIKSAAGKEERKLGPWTEDILFSIEGSTN